MKKPDFDPKKIPPQPSLKKTIWMVILFHLATGLGVAAIILTDGEITLIMP